MSQLTMIIIAGVLGAVGLAGLAWVFLRPKPAAGRSTLASQSAGVTAGSVASGSGAPVLGDEARARLVKQAEAQFEAVVQDGTKQFRADLAATSTLLSDQVKRMTTEIITEELESYRHSLEDLRKQALAVMAEVQKAVEQQRTALATGLEGEMKVERERLGAQLDTKLAEMVSSFLVETLGNKVDMGAQGTYLFQMLEEHKAELAKELTDVV
jgi:phenylpyruvate tautomerase PptA (4-oxalocrotonate tautomerase family)